MFRIAHFLIFIVLLATPAHAEDLETVRISLTSGAYDQAIAEGELLGDTDGLLLAAEALNTKILLRNSEDDKKDAKRAMAIAQQILSADPDNNEAKLLYAISYGFYGRSMSPISAWRKKIPQKSRVKIEEAVAANPDDPNSYALFGGWHMAVAAKAGTKTAKKNYNATIEEGIAHFEKALTGAPDDVMINSNFAMMLYASDRERYTERVRKHIEHIQSLPAQNAAEEHVQALTKELKANLDKPKKAKKIAEKFLDW